MTARYAIYYAPPAECLLWAKASAWLGRDAYSGRAVARPPLPGLEDLDLDALTSDPRSYGFHATLKAPFELAQDRTEAGLLDFSRAFADAQPPFQAAIAPTRLGRFHAFRTIGVPAAMRALHDACVEAFDPFRAPMSAFDLDRRRKAGLTPDQDRRLVEWGYPYIFEDFRFHMTLTNALREEAVSARIATALAAYFANETGPHLFDGVAVFKQDHRNAPFRILERFAFRAPVAAR
jgi:hypothetical protein